MADIWSTASFRQTIKLLLESCHIRVSINGNTSMKVRFTLGSILNYAVTVTVS